jgi:hypothetical protein
MQRSLQKLVGMLGRAARGIFPPSRDSLDPARGVFYGLIASAILWLLIYLVVRFVWGALAALVVTA